MMRSKILYIDDTPSARMLVRRLLSRQYDFEEADDGLKGIELAAKIKPDLILVDLHMPHLNGYEVATRIKSLTPDVPIIALTADITTHVRERVLASGCDGYLSKPIDPDTFVDQVQAYLGGEREKLQDDSFRREYQQRLVARLEENVRELSEALEKNKDLNKQNLQLLHNAQRRAKLLEAGARVSRSIASILDLDTLLNAIVDTIADEFGLYYVAVFLLDQDETWAVLRAGCGDAGQKLLNQNHRLGVGGQSIIGSCTKTGQACVASDVTQIPGYAPNPLLALTRSEIALPLKTGDKVIGALDVQSTELAAFSEDDLTALQIMADQLAIAINNARLLNRLEEAHHELVRSKTYEAIATATGEAIHWVGNKAAPIPGSIARITEDVARFLYIAHLLLDQASPELREHKYAQLIEQAVVEIAGHGIDIDAFQDALESRPLKRLQRVISMESIFEDLEIIEVSARAILNIKEDLIGPARKRKITTVSIPELLTETVTLMGIPKDAVRTVFVGDQLVVKADRMQLDRVFVNLIKNAMEAMHKVEDKTLLLWARVSDDGQFVEIDVTDNGEGIAPDQLEKIWMAFYTTKGDRGGTGLGLPACAQIIGELGGRLSVESDWGLGTTFTVFIPIAE
ncbi:MAG: response regulator [Anaerolineae bacterium]|nr:response regulator [Anaerolineae bacterium]